MRIDSDVAQIPPRDPNTPRQSPATSMPTQIFEINPYENHPELSQTEADVLWEYAKLSHRLKIVCVSGAHFLRYFHLNQSRSQDDRGDQAT